MDWFYLCESTNDINGTYSCWYSHLRSIIENYVPLKTVSIYVLMVNLGWIVKYSLQLRGGTACSEFIIIRQSEITWERYQAQRNIVTSLIRFAKKIILFESLRPGDCTITSASTIGPGSGPTSFLTDFDETWPV